MWVSSPRGQPADLRIRGGRGGRAGWHTALVERIEVELFTDPGNDAVVRLPGRRFPGIVVQGDRLSALRDDLAAIVAHAGGPVTDIEDLRADLDLLLSDVDALVTRYEDALRTHAVPLPYVRAQPAPPEQRPHT